MAITYDNSAKFAYAASPISGSYTNNGNLLLAFIFSSQDRANAPTYNGVAMTLIDKSTYPGVGRDGIAAFYLKNPATGSNTFSASTDNGSNLAAFIISLSNTNTTTQPDNYAINYFTGTSNFTGSVTVNTSNSYLVMSQIDAGLGGSPSYTAGTGTTLRQTDTTLSGYICDSNGVVTSGSQSLIVTGSGATSSAAAIIVSVAPIRDIKTINGLAIGSVKTWDNLAIASVKSINGLN